MEFVLRDIPHIKIYCDDILILSKTKDEHFRTLDMIFQRCAKYGIKLSPPKCQLLQTSVNFIGHKLNRGTVEPEHDKLAKIKDLTPPSSHSELNSIIGFFNFFVASFLIMPVIL